MNILVLTTHLNCGGITRYLINLTKGLSKLHKVWVASSGGEWEERLKPYCTELLSIPIRTKCIISIKVFISFFKLIPFVIRNKVDIICANTRVTQFLAYLLYRSLGVKYVSVYHGFYKPRFIRKLFKFEGVRTIAISNAVKDHLIKDLRIKKDKIRVIYHGIDLEEFDKTSSRRQEFGLKNDDVVLGILGRISPEKGHFLVIEAFKRLKDKYTNVYLLISGEGRFKDKLRVCVKKESLEDRVKLISLRGEDFLGIVDVLIVASSQEGFGYVILEAFAMEVCVIGFSVGGIKEIIKDRDTGLLFYTYDPAALICVIEKLLKDMDLRKQLVLNAKKKLADFNLEEMVRKTESVYREVLSL